MTALTEFAELKRLPVEYLQRRHVNEHPNGIRFDYGSDARSRVRKSATSAHPTYWATGDARPMRALGYQLVEKFAEQSDRTILIVEGESDTLTAWFHRRPALGVPGSTMAHLLVSADVVWAKRAIIVREPGTAGEKFVLSVAKRLREIGFAGETFEVSLSPHKDVSELHVAVVGDREQFATRLDEAIAKATPVELEAVQPRESALMSASDLLNCPEEYVNYLIDGLLPRGGIMLLAAKPKCGKSVLARNLALAACRGSTFLGRQVEKTPVLWLCLEETRAQVSAAFRAMGLRADDQIYFFFGHAARDAHAWLQRMCEQVDAGLVVIDTWHKLTLIENVNDYGAVNRANQPLQQLAREKGVAQVWIHHANKGIARNGSEVLGSQALFAAVDTLASMDRSEDGTRTIWTIQRSDDDLEPTVVMMDDDQRVVALGTKRETEIARAEQSILDALGDDPVLTSELKHAAGVRTTLFWSAIGGLVRKGYARREGRGSRQDPYRYTLGNQNPVSGTTSSEADLQPVPKVPVIYKEPREPELSSSGTSSELRGTSGTSGTSGISSTGDLLAYGREVLGDA
jgi:hypothetical protein